MSAYASEINTTQEILVNQAESGFRTIIELPDGKRWVRLENSDAIRVEGIRLNNCFGQDNFLWKASDYEFPLGAYALRGADGSPELMVEVEKNGIVSSVYPNHPIPEHLAEHPDFKIMKVVISALHGQDDKQISVGQLPDLQKLIDHLNIYDVRDRLPEEYRVIDGQIRSFDQIVAWVDDLVRRSKAGGSIPRIKGNLWLDGLPIRELPARLSVEGWMNVRYCRLLKSLPEDLDVGYHLTVGYCPALEHIGEGLRVGRNFYLSDCQSLNSLPKRAMVGGSLNISDCPSIDTIPDGVEVGEDIIAGNNVRSESGRTITPPKDFSNLRANS
jgi:hypothetical protein